MTKTALLALIFTLSAGITSAASSMRRCTLLPVTDSVGGAIGFKVFQELEQELKGSTWCTYISNSGMLSVFSKYGDNLPRYLKTKEVLETVSNRLKVGSIIRVALVSDVPGTELQLDVMGANGEDVYLSEKKVLKRDDTDLIVDTVRGWLDVFAQTIPYDARITGVLGDQVTMEIGKGYPVEEGQNFVIKRPAQKLKHPLLKKVVDWETTPLADGVVTNVSENQALGVVKVYLTSKDLKAGDWVRLLPKKPEPVVVLEEPKEEGPGTLGIVTLAFFGSSTAVDTAVSDNLIRMSGTVFGIDLRGEGWITREYFGAIEFMRSMGGLSQTSGTPNKDRINTISGSTKLLGGYRYLPIGFFYGPQIDFYGGYSNYTFDLNYSRVDGFGNHGFSGLTLGASANIPVNRDYRFFVKAEFLPFPSFEDQDRILGGASNASSLELEVGIKYHHTVRMTFDGSIETVSNKAKFSKNTNIKEVSYKDNRLKLGVSFNF